jgi:hypothetical protein
MQFSISTTNGTPGGDPCNGFLVNEIHYNDMRQDSVQCLVPACCATDPACRREIFGPKTAQMRVRRVAGGGYVEPWVILSTWTVNPGPPTQRVIQVPFGAISAASRDTSLQFQIRAWNSAGQVPSIG